MDLIALFRVTERLTLTAVVLLVSIVVIIGFWRSVQKIDLTNGGVTGVAGTFIFSTPVFVLLAIIGYAWVSLEHPVTLSPSAGEAAEAPGTKFATGAGALPSGFVGSVDLTGANAGDGHGLAEAIQRVKSLNCIASDRDLANRDKDNLDQVKFELLRPFWQSDWGDVDEFMDWATGRSEVASDPEAVSVWTGKHALC